MTDKELRELESLAVDQDRLFDPAAVIALIAEVRRMNQMVDKACQIIAENPDCAIDKTGVRKYLESEVDDK